MRLVHRLLLIYSRFLTHWSRFLLRQNRHIVAHVLLKLYTGHLLLKDYTLFHSVAESILLLMLLVTLLFRRIGLIDEEYCSMYALGCASFLQFYNARTSSCGKPPRDAEVA